VELAAMRRWPAPWGCPTQVPQSYAVAIVKGGLVLNDRSIDGRGTFAQVRESAQTTQLPT